MKQETLIIANALSERITELKKHREEIMGCAVLPDMLDDGGTPFQHLTLYLAPTQPEWELEYHPKLRSEFLPQAIDVFMSEYIECLDAEIRRLQQEFENL